MNNRLSVVNVLGDQGPGIVAAMRAALRVLDTATSEQLLQRVGSVIPEAPAFEAIGKSMLQDSYGGAQKGPSDDLLAGRGLFYITEQRRLFLDCTAGHYQMLWGYNHPELCRAVEEATRTGVVWDNHSNIPQAPLKRLGGRLLAAANAPGERDPLDTALLGVCTGSVACSAALKIQLKVFERDKGNQLIPAIIVLDGSYHGTDMVAQHLRGMWPGLVQRCEMVKVQANDPEELQRAFLKYSGRVAGFWAEPVLMNREAIAVQPEYLKLARRLCDESGALMCIDEIQTCFWRPEFFESRALDLRPDLLVLGKGMTSGFHPLSGVLFKQRHDVLEQYDAISTNGSAALPAFVALCAMELIEQHAADIGAIASRIENGFRELASGFPEQVESAQGRGYLAGLKFRRVADAKTFHKDLLDAGLWARVHAYHEGHRTVLTKLGLMADAAVVDFVLTRFRDLLRQGRERASTNRQPTVAETASAS